MDSCMTAVVILPAIVYFIDIRVFVDTVNLNTLYSKIVYRFCISVSTLARSGCYGVLSCRKTVFLLSDGLLSGGSL